MKSGIVVLNNNNTFLKDIKYDSNNYYINADSSYNDFIAPYIAVDSALKFYKNITGNSLIEKYKLDINTLNNEMSGWLKVDANNEEEIFKFMYLYYFAKNHNKDVSKYFDESKCKDLMIKLVNIIENEYKNAVVNDTDDPIIKNEYDYYQDLYRIKDEFYDDFIKSSMFEKSYYISKENYGEFYNYLDDLRNSIYKIKDLKVTFYIASEVATDINKKVQKIVNIKLEYTITGYDEYNYLKTFYYSEVGNTIN